MTVNTGYEKRCPPEGLFRDLRVHARCFEQDLGAFAVAEACGDVERSLILLVSVVYVHTCINQKLNNLVVSAVCRQLQ